jgi:ribosomal protein S18 acetylase RimI-like enzyme
MLVRPAVPADADTVAHINVHTWQVAYAGLVPAAILDGMTVRPRAERLREAFGRPRTGGTLVVVDDSGEVRGYAHYGAYRIDRDPARLHPTEGEIHAIYVHPDSWSTGAGSALITGVLVILAGQGRTMVRLWVLAGNDRARRFYERCGFTADGTTDIEQVTVGEGATAELAEVRYTLTRPAAPTGPALAAGPRD